MKQEELARRAAAAGVSPQLLARQKKELQRLTKCSARTLRDEARGLAVAEDFISAAIGALRPPLSSSCTHASHAAVLLVQKETIRKKT